MTPIAAILMMITSTAIDNARRVLGIIIQTRQEDGLVAERARLVEAAEQLSSRPNKSFRSIL